MIVYEKSDLRTGMWVEMANGDLGMILLNVNNAYMRKRAERQKAY